MKLLLDTHILLWTVAEPRRLSPRVRRMLDRPSIEKWLSPISTWELILLAGRGDLTTDVPFAAWFAEVTAALALNEAPLTHDVVLASREVTVPHRDPADRLLAATARYYDLRLVTADERLLNGSGFVTLAG